MQNNGKGGGDNDMPHQEISSNSLDKGQYMLIIIDTGKLIINMQDPKLLFRLFSKVLMHHDMV